MTVSQLFPSGTSSDVNLDTSNVKRLSLKKNLVDKASLILDNQGLGSGSGNETVYLEKRQGRWSVSFLHFLSRNDSTG